MSTHPANHTAGEHVTLTAHTAASVTELLGMCEEFLRTAGPLTHAELRTYLRRRTPPADPSWFIDVLGFTGLHLHHLLPADTTPPSEDWHHDPADELAHQLDPTPDPLTGPPDRSRR